MLKTMPSAALLVVVLAAASGGAQAQLPPGVFAGEQDLKAAAAGTYAIDPGHTSVVAKVSHIGYALSVFRFGRVDGTLSWDPAQPEKSTLKIAVATESIASPVPGFAKELAGGKYLNSAAFPKAMFVSTGFHQGDALHGTVEGQFTLLGVTRPLTFDVTLQGAGKGFMGHARIGVAATAQIDPKAFGLNAMFNTPIRLDIDAEFEQRG